MSKLLCRWLSAAVVAATALLQVSTMASATAIFDPTVGTCTGANCDSIELGGRLSGTNGQAGPWTIEVLAGLNECIRLQVLTSNDADVEMVAISPNGQFYRNDDGLAGSCTKCPLLKFQAPSRGNYSVSISHRAGVAKDVKFRFAYGRYPAGNANCNNPNPPK
jgi:hypothetical protein